MGLMTAPTGLPKFASEPNPVTLKPFLQVLFLTWVLFRCLGWYGRWRGALARDRLSSEFAQELRRRGLLSSHGGALS